MKRKAPKPKVGTKGDKPPIRLSRQPCGEDSKKPRVKPSDANIVKELCELHDKLHLIFCSAMSVALALRNNTEGAEEELARCLKVHVVEEVWNLGEQLDLIMLDIGGKPRFLPIQEDLD